MFDKNADNRQRYRAAKEKGLCVRCRTRPVINGVICDDCRLKHNADRKSGRSRNTLKNRYHRYKKNNRCVKCGRGKSNAKGVLCLKCQKYRMEHKRQTRRIRRINGMCWNCKTGIAVAGVPYCKDCRDRINDKSRAVRLARKSSGLCTHCESPVVEGRSQCQFHLDRGRDIMRQKRKRMRRGIMKCLTCGKYGPPGKRYCSTDCMELAAA